MDVVYDFLSRIITNDYLLITIVSSLPLIELLKGSILFGIAKGLSPFFVFCLSFLGSSIVAPVIMLCLRPFIALLKKIPPVKKLALALETKLQAKATRFKHKNDIVNASKGIILSLMLFVAIPVPMTGVWSGAALAVFLNIDYTKALFAIIFGNLIAGVIVLTIAMFFQPYSDIIFLGFIGLVVGVICASICIIIIKRCILRKNLRKKMQN